VLLVFVAASLTLAAVGSAGATVGMGLAPVDSTFPARAYQLRLANKVALTPAQVDVRENGAPVTDLTLTLEGAKHGSRYLIRYLSPSGPSLKVFVSVSVSGQPGSVTETYNSPALSLPTFHRSRFSRIILSTYTGIAVILICALLIGLAISSAFRPTHANLRKRMAEFVSMATPREDRPALGAPRTGMLGGTERSLESRAWWAKFNKDLEIAQIKMPAIEILALTVIATVVAVLALTLIAGSALFGAVGLLTPFASRSLVRSKLNRRRKEFAEQLPDTLQIIASALRGGHSLVGSLSVVVESSSEPMKTEMQRVVSEEQLGTPLEDAFTEVSERMENRDLEQLALVARLQRDTGVSAAEVIDRVTETVRERFELRRLVSTLTSQARMSRWIVTLLPVGLLVVISLLNPHYMHPLFAHLGGRIALVGSSFLVAGGSLVIKKIVEIRV
jgi:tight adherence protein B